MSEEKEKTTPSASVGADAEQSNPYTNIIQQNDEEIKSFERDRKNYLRMISDPYFIPTVTLTELFEKTYDSKSPIIDGLLYPGAYLFVGAPKIGKSFLMMQIAYHVCKGIQLWDFNVHKCDVAYFALEDDYERLQRRFCRMFGEGQGEELVFSNRIDNVNGMLEQQLNSFMQEHQNVKLIIIDTLQKIREATNDYSYGNDYQVISKLKEFADSHRICLLLVHHTRKQQAGDSFDMISGTNGLLGAADGAFIMYKEKRTENKAFIEISGRDQQEQKLTLTKNLETLCWELESRETELWKPKPDAIIKTIADFITQDNPEWYGAPTELVSALQIDLKPNTLTLKLNMYAEMLASEYGIDYEYRRTHEGRKIRLTLNRKQEA